MLTYSEMDAAVVAAGITIGLAIVMLAVALMAYSTKKLFAANVRKDRVLSMLATFIADALTSRALDAEIGKLDEMDSNAKNGFLTRNFDNAPRGDQEERAITQVLVKKTRMNINALPGYYEHKVLTGQSPLAEEVVTLVRAFRKYKVGTLVLVGDLGNKANLEKEKIYPFVPSKEGQCIVTADGKGKLAKFESTKVLVEDGVSWLKANVSLANEGCCTCPCGENSQFEMNIILMPVRMDHKDEASVKCLCTGIDRLAQQQLNDIQRGMPGLAILCASGVELSALVTSAYFTYQGYEDTEKTSGNGKVNVIGIARHVAEYRPGSFSQKDLGLDKAFAQVRMLFATVRKLVDLQISSKQSQP